MGDRALVVFYQKRGDEVEVSPTVYLHWMGSYVPDLLREHAELMETRKGDVRYAAARFIGICHAHDAKSNLSLGVWNTPDYVGKAINANDVEILVQYSHGDAGIFLVDVDTFEYINYNYTHHRG